jgi:hypothetical protein
MPSESGGFYCPETCCEDLVSYLDFDSAYLILPNNDGKS